MRVAFTAAARNDLKDIAAYIAQDAPKRARSFAAELRVKCLALADNPLSGSLRAEIRPNLRILPHGRYTVYYEFTSEEVLILRIYHSARLIDVDHISE
jgi:toxin ParE1/3/4